VTSYEMHDAKGCDPLVSSRPVAARRGMKTAVFIAVLL
jgi:hypothetical protein